MAITLKKLSPPRNTKPSKAVDKIKQAAKPAITTDQLKKAKEYVAAGGSIDAIESKYKLTNEQKANITKA